MSKQKLTPWFPADVKPVHVGVYQRGYTGQSGYIKYWYWNGSFWEIGGWYRAEDAAKNPRSHTLQEDLCWRGVISPIPTNQPQKEIDL